MPEGMKEVRTWFSHADRMKIEGQWSRHSHRTTGYFGIARTLQGFTWKWSLMGWENSKSGHSRRRRTSSSVAFVVTTPIATQNNRDTVRRFLHNFQVPPAVPMKTNCSCRKWRSNYTGVETRHWGLYQESPKRRASRTNVDHWGTCSICLKYWWRLDIIRYQGDNMEENTGIDNICSCVESPRDLVMRASSRIPPPLGKLSRKLPQAKWLWRTRRTQTLLTFWYSR